MKKIILLFSAILVLGVSSLSAQTKVGFMNPQEVLDQLPERNVIEEQLNRWLDQQEAEFEELAMEFQTRVTRFQEQASSMTESQARTEQRELQAINQQIEQFQARVERDLERRQAELLQPILTEMNAIIEQIAEDKGLTYVLNEATSTGEMLMLHVAEGAQEYNLTQAVLDRMLN